MDYSRQMASATRLVTKYGSLVTYTSYPRSADEAYLPTSDVAGVAYPNTPMVQVNAGVARYFKEQFKINIDPSTTQGSLQMLMPGNVGFTPYFRDGVTWTDGNQYIVDDYDVIAPDGTPILYFITLNEAGTSE